MFIYNLKLNSSIIYKVLFAIIIIFVISLCFIIGYRLYNATIKVNDEIENKDVINITSKNYTNILKSVHDDINTYVGKKIKFSGFVYRVYDLDKEQFILGRNMIISSDFQSVVVGFLCHYKDSLSLKDSSWIEIEGKITKGTYHNSEMPILEIKYIKEVDKPNDEYVYPPDEAYIPTVNNL